MYIEMDYDETANPFHFSVLPFDPMPDEPTAPSVEVQEEALADICYQLISYLTIAANSKADTTRVAYILACCDRICDVYACAGFNLFSEFKHELRTDLRSALRKARRAFLKHGTERGS
jgi:hypothetical protein